MCWALMRCHQNSHVVHQVELYFLEYPCICSLLPKTQITIYKTLQQNFILCSCQNFKVNLEILLQAMGENPAHQTNWKAYSVCSWLMCCIRNIRSWFWIWTTYHICRFEFMFLFLVNKVLSQEKKVDQNLKDKKSSKTKANKKKTKDMVHVI